ncbi:helix-turn-helix domain-containing protein [Actinoplanes rectilineatus]|uniref:helix-turn-helix domain-containing protein n=1 Tax=Actinoplanes rectilineatus TaxID=113571 RepID=UPI0005F2EB7F|nr:helix-turn-helix transcriptional regulator [Actinoplanes rectilineatus]
MTRRTSPVLLRRQLGDELRRHREAAGLKAADVARALGVNPSVMSRLENGQRRPILVYIGALCDHYHLGPAAAESLKNLARAAHEEGWWSKWNTPSDYVGFEAGATTIRNYELALVPGLLQTRAYARALLADVEPGLGRRELEEAVDFRMMRQRILFSEDPVSLHVVLGEAVLAARVGDAATSRDQLIHLRECAELPNVVLQILPVVASAASALVGGFSILEFADDLISDRVHAETTLGAVSESKTEDVNRCRTIFAHLSESAADEAESLQLVDAALRSRES